MTRIHTIKYVKDLIESRGYKMLSTEYGGASSKIQMLCPKGHKYECFFSSFQRGHECGHCTGHNRWNLENIREELAKEGYVLLAKEYKGVHYRLAVKCPKEHFCSISWAGFQRGNKCKICGEEKRAQGRRIDIRDIRKVVEGEGYTLISKEYKGPNKKLESICPKGHKYYFQWYRFKVGTRCGKCAINTRQTQVTVKQAIESAGYQLLSSYKGSHQSLQIRCDKGHDYEVTWTNFQQGYRCPECIEWRGEINLGRILEQIYPGRVERQDNLTFLKKQRVDFSIRDLRLAIEYDGEQHFKPVQYGGMSLRQAKKNFKIQQERDNRKNKLCKEGGWKVIRIRYDEDLTLENIRNKIENE